jgi:outer membrane protein OmpA-like peptidoglycan-associated protein
MNRYWSRRFALACALACAAALAGCQTPKRGLTPQQEKVLRESGFIEGSGEWTLDQSVAVLFGTNQAKLSQHGVHSIAQMGKMLLSADLTKLRVVGYTDATGDDGYNDKLSKRRAEAVVEVLVGLGFPPGGLQAIGMGKRHPVADNSTKEGRAQNRHVAIIVDIN